MSAVPSARAVTRPLDETVATPGVDVVQVACADTSLVAPVLRVAVADSWRVWPISIRSVALFAARTCTLLVDGVGVTGGGAGSSEPHATARRHPETSARDQRRE